MNLQAQIMQAFEELAREVESRPDAWSRLQTRIRSRRRRTLVLSSVAAAGFVAVAIVVLTHIGTSQPPVVIGPESTPTEWSVYRDGELGWSLRAPPGWHVQPFDEKSRIWVRGVLVSNVDHAFRHPEIPGGYTTAWDFTGLPDDLVAVQFQHGVGGPRPERRSDSTFPLSLDDATSVQGPEGLPGQPPPSVFLPVTVKGDSGYAVTVWLAPNASQADREVARRIVASITFEG